MKQSPDQKKAQIIKQLEAFDALPSITITRTVTTTADVKRCQDCPFFRSFKEGPECDEITRLEKLKEQPEWYNAIVYPEGRDGIHPNCPFNKEQQ